MGEQPASEASVKRVERAVRRGNVSGNLILRIMLSVQIVLIVGFVAMFWMATQAYNAALNKGEQAHTAICVIRQQASRDAKATEVFLSDPDVSPGARLYLQRYLVGLNAETQALEFIECP